MTNIHELMEQKEVQRQKILQLRAALASVQEWMHATCPTEEQAPFGEEVKKALAATAKE